VGLHGLTSITLGVPDIETVAGYYEEFGLTPSERSPDGLRRTFATVDGGDQLTITPAARRRSPPSSSITSRTPPTPASATLT